MSRNITLIWQHHHRARPLNEHHLALRDLISVCSAVNGLSITTVSKLLKVGYGVNL